MPPAWWAEKEGSMRLLSFSDDVTPRKLRVPTPNTEHPNSTLCIAHPYMLAPALVFPAITSELLAIIVRNQ
ncbi:hypothetical protein BC827DRAFT_1224139 [Russula dissimulans]|nr:hypothetical protein BC827DRAFT_1224139 [Russula dissimulans]